MVELFASRKTNLQGSYGLTGSLSFFDDSDFYAAGRPIPTEYSRAPPMRTANWASQTSYRRYDDRVPNDGVSTAEVRARQVGAASTPPLEGPNDEMGDERVRGGCW